MAESYDIEMQKVLVELLISDSDLFGMCNGIVKDKYFDPALKKGVAFIQKYFEEFRELPPTHIIKAETGIEFTQHAVSKGERDYAAKEVEKFCREQAVWDAIYAGPELHEKGDFETIWQMIKEASSISLNKDLGISYFDNVGGRLRDLLNNSPVLLTGWEDVDEAIGGISRQELVLFAAGSGVGKSITMANLAMNLVRQGYRGIYISLELADRVVAKRFDSMVTGISQSDILKKIEDVAVKVNSFHSSTKGELFIKRMPESITTSNHIRAYLKEFEQAHGFVPDFIVVDYIDLMATNKNISSENIWLSDKFKAEELRSIGADYDCVIITASQLGRSSWEADKINQSHIQGGISKIQTCDVMIAIIQSDQMRAAGEYMFEYVKTRNSGAVGTGTVLAWDPISLKISTMTDSSKKLQLVPKNESINTLLSTSNTLFGDMNKFNDSEKPSLLDLVSRSR